MVFPTEPGPRSVVLRNLNCVNPFLALLLVSAPSLASSKTAPREGAVFRWRVPLNHERPRGGTFQLTCEFAAPFNRRLPTVFVVADGQQFYVRPGAMAKVAQERIGSGFNVGGIYGRASAPEIAKEAAPGGKVSWRSAYELLRASQWVEDIEFARRQLLGKGKVCLFGQSGGAFLVHQYLARHGRKVSRAATSAVVMPYWAKRLGLVSDRFWDEIGEEGRSLAHQILASSSYARMDLVEVFQRQNFFVPADRLKEERLALLRSLASGDPGRLKKLMDDYQVTALREMTKGPLGLAIRVRLFEFFSASGAEAFMKADRLMPDFENSRGDALPLLQAGLQAPAWPFSAPHRLSAEVLVISGVRDHTVDYRTSIALAASYPRGTLALLDDDHMFSRTGRPGLRRLVGSFLRGGATSHEFRKAVLEAPRARL